MNLKTVRVPQLAFYEDSDLELGLPESWEVEVRAMPGAYLPPLSDDAIREVMANPTGAPRLRDLARKRREAVIIFDDIARPTPVSRLWPFVVEELHSGGMKDSQIRFVVALGTHGAHSRSDFVRKLGEEALLRFPVWNHNCYQHCTLVGTTSNGTPIEINDEVLGCDLRIGIGSVLPHPSMGFGGGPKIILPGVSSFETIKSHHGTLCRRLSSEGAVMRSGAAENPGWQDIAEAARLAKLDFVVDSILNLKRGVVGLVAGDVIEAWRKGVPMARQVYGTEPASDADVVITNGYAKGNEAMISPFAPGINFGAEPEGRDVVAISNCPNGVVVHYLQGDFGPCALGDLNRGTRRAKPEGIRNMLFYTPYAERSSRSFFGAPDDGQWVSDWEDVLDRLSAWHPNGAKVVVYPDLTMQYLLPEEEMGGG